MKLNENQIKLIDAQIKRLIASESFFGKMLKEHGIEKFLFGSDFPMWDHEDEMTRFNQLDLTAEERQAVLYDNGRALLEKIGAWK